MTVSRVESPPLEVVLLRNASIKWPFSDEITIDTVEDLPTRCQNYKRLFLSLSSSAGEDGKFPSGGRRGPSVPSALISVRSPPGHPVYFPVCNISVPSPFGYPPRKKRLQSMTVLFFLSPFPQRSLPRKKRKTVKKSW